MVVGDGGCEAYTAIVWGALLSSEIPKLAEAETVSNVEGNMCGTAMRGADALPGSKATSRAKGSHRNLGDLVSGRCCRVRSAEYSGPHREGEEPKPMMHGDEKSELAIVAKKPANKAKKSTAEASAGEVAAEPVERRAGTKGNVGQQRTRRTQSRVSVSQALERIRQTFAVMTRGRRSYGAGRRRLWHLHRPYELMEIAPWPKSMISAEA